MRLTRRDGVATVMAGLVAAVALAVTRSWDWPMLGSYRAGVAALGVIGWSMCIVGSSRTTFSFKGPFVVFASALGGLALLLVIVGLVTGQRPRSYCWPASSRSVAGDDTPSRGLGEACGTPSSRSAGLARGGERDADRRPDGRGRCAGPERHHPCDRPERNDRLRRRGARCSTTADAG